MKRETFKIEKGIPLQSLPPRPRKELYPFAKMEIGDSFFIPCNNRAQAIQKSYSIKSSLKQRQKTFNSPIEVQTFYDETGVRCWRIK